MTSQKYKSIESSYESLLSKLKDLANDLTATEKELDIKKVHKKHIDAATNLIHYLGLRRQDVRKLQTELASVGLSS